jgi:methionyl-tRNA synthetase
MVAKYFDGALPDPTTGTDPGTVNWQQLTADAVAESAHAAQRCDARGMVRAGMTISNAVDAYINDTAPFKLAKDPDNLPAVGVILYNCAEALRVAAHLMRPAMPTKMTDALTRLGDRAIDAPLNTATTWGGLQPGATVPESAPA